MNKNIALDWGIVIAAVTALIYVVAPYFRKYLGKHTSTFGAFGAGVAISYVFIHLVAELDKDHALLGSRIHLVMLVGFFVYFWVESRYLPKSEGGDAEKATTGLDLRLAFGWLYGWLLLYTLPDAMTKEGLLILSPLFAISLHLFYESFHEAETDPVRFDRKDRFILASGPVAGWLTDLYFFEDEVIVSGMLTAFLSGSVIYKVFSRELPRTGSFSKVWFAAGVILFALFESIGRY